MRRLSGALTLLLLAAAAAIAAAGCLAGTPVDENSYVMSIGVDAGLTRKYYVSFLIQLEGNSQQSGVGQGEMVLAAEGDNLFEAIGNAQLAVTDNLSFTRTNYIAFSLDVAKTQMMNGFMDVALNELGIRRSVKLFVVRGSCNEYFKGLNSPTEPSVTKRQLGMYHSYESRGTLPMTNLSLYREAVSGGRFDVMLPTGSVDTSNETFTGTDSSGGEGGSNGATGSGTTAGVNRDSGLSSYPWGCAVFNGEALAGVLSGDDTKYLLMARGEFKEGYIYYKNEHSEYAFALTATKKAGVKLEVDGEGVPRAEVGIVLSARVQVDTAGDLIEIWENGLKEEFEGYLEAQLARVFLICRDMGSDVLGFGRYMSMRFKSTRSWEEYDWKEKYMKMEVAFNVNVGPENTMIAESKG